MNDNSLANTYYEAWFVLSTAETQLDEALLTAFGATPDDTKTWPCGDLIYDWYDDSFELRGTRDDFVPTPEQLANVWPLGFAHGWICFKDGTEIFVSPKAIGTRKPSHWTGAADQKRREWSRPCPLCLKQRRELATVVPPGVVAP